MALKVVLESDIRTGMVISVSPISGSLSVMTAGREAKNAFTVKESVGVMTSGLSVTVSPFTSQYWKTFSSSELALSEMGWPERAA